MRFTTVTNLMKLKLKRSIEYNLRMQVKLCITNILDLRIKKNKYKIVRIGSVVCSHSKRSCETCRRHNKQHLICDWFFPSV